MPETCRIVVIGVGRVFPSDPLRRKTWIHTIKRGETHLQSLNPSTNAVVRILNRTTNCLKLNTVTIFNLFEIFLIYTLTK